jgi:fused signal recognition particle receptor
VADGSLDWEAATDALISADVGPLTSERLVAVASEVASATGIGARAALAAEIERILRAVQVDSPLAMTDGVVLLVGINGGGKTTTAAKLAARLTAAGRTVLLVAADTFRPAAIEQLRLWADRIGVPIIAQTPGADPGAVTFDALTAASARGIEIVIVDTAGRLHSRGELMAELAKVRRVVERQRGQPPEHVLLVIDATTGQNGLAQAAGFAREAGVTGIVLTKVDGSARGGIAVAIAAELSLPIVLIGTGETVSDLAPFDPSAYVAWLLGS